MGEVKLVVLIETWLHNIHAHTYIDIHIHIHTHNIDINSAMEESKSSHGGGETGCVDRGGEQKFVIEIGDEHVMTLILSRKVCVCMYTCMCVCVCVCVCVHACIHAYIYSVETGDEHVMTLILSRKVCVCICVCVHVYMHTYIMSRLQMSMS